MSHLNPTDSTPDAKLLPRPPRRHLSCPALNSDSDPHRTTCDNGPARSRRSGLPTRCPRSVASKPGAAIHRVQADRNLPNPVDAHSCRRPYHGLVFNNLLWPTMNHCRRGRTANHRIHKHCALHVQQRAAQQHRRRAWELWLRQAVEQALRDIEAMGFPQRTPPEQDIHRSSPRSGH